MPSVCKRRVQLGVRQVCVGVRGEGEMAVRLGSFHIFHCCVVLSFHIFALLCGTDAFREYKQGYTVLIPLWLWCKSPVVVLE